ncbi:MAG: TonB-dependent receptor [Pseudomonadota bacterium]
MTNAINAGGARRFVERLLAGTAVAAVATTGAATTAAAQFDDEIIVTATKREKTLQEVPVAVSVVDDSVIEQAQVFDLFDLQTVVPSLRISQLQNSSQTTFIIRGFGNGANNPGIESSVGVFIDGVFRSRSASAILDLPTLERVEVLRGPQSTLFGKNVSAGAISITTKRPDFDWGGSVEATAGNFDQIAFRGTLTGPLAENLAFRVSGSINKRDGFYTNVVDGSDVNDRDRWAARAQLLWEPTDTLSFRVIGDYNRISNETCCGVIQTQLGPVTGIVGAGVPLPGGGFLPGLGEAIDDGADPFDREIALNALPTNTLEGRGASIQADWDLGVAQLTSITSYREQTDENNGDIDFTAAAVAENPISNKFETFTQELRISSVGTNTIDWLVGAFVFDEKVTTERDIIFEDQARAFFDLQTALAGAAGALGDIETQLGLPPSTFFAPGQGVFTEFDMDNLSYSFFGQVAWNVTDRLTITGGVAYTYDEKEVVSDLLLTDVFSRDIDLELLGFAGAFTQFTGLPATPQNIGALSGAPFNPALVAPAVFSNPGAATTVGGAATVLSQTPCDPGNPLLLCNSALALLPVQLFQPQTNFPDPNNPEDDGILEDDQITYTAQVAYDLLDNVNVYFTYATGWKAGAFNLSNDSQPPNVAGLGRTAAPEDVRLFEIGAKARFDGGFINVALFDQKIEDFQSNLFVGTGFQLANAGEQSVRGFEIESAYSPVDPLVLNFALTYLDPEYDSFLESPCASFVPACQGFPAPLSFDASGTDPAGIHPVSIATSAVYTHDFANGAVGFGRIEYQYESDTQVIDNVPAAVASREQNLLAASVGYETEGGFGVTIWGRNLTDDDFQVSAFPSVAQPGSFSGYANQPRTYGLTIRKRF